MRSADGHCLLRTKGARRPDLAVRRKGQTEFPPCAKLDRNLTTFSWHVMPTPLMKDFSLPWVVLSDAKASYDPRSCRGMGSLSWVAVCRDWLRLVMSRRRATKACVHASKMKASSGPTLESCTRVAHIDLAEFTSSGHLVTGATPAENSAGLFQQDPRLSKTRTPWWPDSAASIPCQTCPNLLNQPVRQLTQKHSTLKKH